MIVLIEAVQVNLQQQTYSTAYSKHLFHCHRALKQYVGLSFGHGLVRFLQLNLGNILLCALIQIVRVVSIPVLLLDLDWRNYIVSRGF